MKKLYFFLLLLPVFSIAQKLQGQPLIDSLLVELPKMEEDTIKVNLLYNISFQYRYVNPKIGVIYGKKIIELAKKLNWKAGVSKGLYGVGVNQYHDSDFKNAIKNFDKAILFTANSKTIISNLNFKAQSFQSLKNYPKALSIYYESLSLAEQIKDVESQQMVLGNLGNLYYLQNNFTKAISLYKKAFSLAKSTNDRDSQYLLLANLSGAYSKINDLKQSIFYSKLALDIGLKNNFLLYVTDTYVRIGTAYNNLKEHDSAKQNFEKALQIDKKINDFYNSSVCYEGIGIAYSAKKEYQLAIENFDKAKQINITNKTKAFIATNSTNLGKVYYELSKQSNNKTAFLQKAYLNFSEAIKINMAIGNLEEINLNYHLLSDVQKLQGNYKAALESHVQYVIYKDSVFNSDNKETIKNLEDKREIELRDKELKINKLALEAKEKQKIYFILGLILLAIIVGLLFYQSRNRKFTNLKLETLNKELDQANKTKTRFFNILNHDLRGPVSNLIDFLQIQKNTPEILDEETKNRIQDTTLSSAENLLVSMEDILLWSKGQMENFKPQPKNIAVNQLFEDTQKVFSGYIKIKFEYLNPDNIEIFTDENYLKTIIRNLTSNAINVFTTTKNPTIIWKAWQENNKKYVSITDNGPGASSENFKALYDDTHVVGIKSGLGLHLIRDLAKAINCEITVDSSIGVGTTFVVRFP